MAYPGDADDSRGESRLAGEDGLAHTTPETPPPVTSEAAPRHSIPVLDVYLDPPLPGETKHAVPAPRSLSPIQAAAIGLTIGLASLAAIFALLIGSDGERRHRIAPLFFNPRGAAPAVMGPSAIAPAESVSSRPAPVPAPSASAPAPAWPAPFRVSDLAKSSDVKLVEGTIDRRTFIDALSEAGVARAQVYRLLTAFKGVRDFERTKRHDTFVAALDAGSRRVRAFEYNAGPTEIYQAREHDDGLLTAERLDLHVERKRALAAIVLGDDIGKSLEQAGLDKSLVDWLDDALEGRAQLSSLRPGSRLRVVVEYETALGSFARYIAMPAIEYIPADPGAPALRVYHSVAQKTQGYFDSSGRAPFKGSFRTPIAFARISSRFNLHRMHPILHVIMPHNGVDFAATAGTPVYAAGPGMVEWLGDSGASGNLVTIRHDNGVTTGYAHLSRFAPHLARGQGVETRQLIGFVGSTGRSTGPHLHFSAKKNGVFIDPLRLRLDGERVLPRIERESFDREREPLDKLLDGIALPGVSETSARAAAKSGETDPQDFEPVDLPAGEARDGG